MSAVPQSLAAIDELRSALGSVCTVESVHQDPLLWLFRCQSDAFFGLGEYSFPSRAPHACAGSPGVSGANGWVCTGAVLSRLLAQSGGGVASVHLLLAGHVDQVQLTPRDGFEPCPQLVRAFRFEPGMQWRRLERGDARLQTDGNDQLAWCRAASVAQQILCGIEQQRGSTGGRLRSRACGSTEFQPASHSNLTFALLGASSRWQRAQPASVCPPCTGTGSAESCRCDSARRVDVMVQFVPREGSGPASCSPPESLGPDARALYCLQQCLERRSAAAQSVRPESHELLGTCATQPASAEGWLQHVTGGGIGCHEVHLGPVGRILGIQ